MKTDRLKFISTSLIGGLAATLPLGSSAKNLGSSVETRLNASLLDDILKQPVFKKELFSSPVIIETLELLRYGNSFLCRVRSKEGAEGISVGHHEFTGFKTDVAFECKTSPLKSVNGVVKVPTGPGSGVEIDPDFVRKHLSIAK